MKLRIFALSIAMVAGVLAANAQTTKTGNDVFVGLGAGVSTVFTPDMSSPAFYANIQVGKFITPAFGVRAVIGGPFQNINSKVIATSFPQDFCKNKLFGELNLDAILNFSNLFAYDLAKFDVYAFVGPTMNLSTKGSQFTGRTAEDGTYLVEPASDLKARFGATAGLGLAYNITNSFALGVEGRFGIAPSIFGDADKYNKAEGTGRLTLNAVWTIGGKNGKLARAAAAAAAAGYLSKAEADAMVADALAKNPKIVEKVVEKEVIKTVEKEVATNVPASTAIFFEIGKATLTQKDKARIKLLADDIKASNFNGVLEVAGYADKQTGSASFNQTLSEKRAQVVYDALIAEGVPASKLQKASFGGVDTMFFNNPSLSRTVIVKTK